MTSPRLVVGCGVALVSLLAAGRAQAYPQLQFSSGTNTCGQCHYSPSGTGLINSWGRGEAGDTISMGGDGRFLHGAWVPPSWLAPGLDVRGAFLANDVQGYDSPHYVWFPMQLDAYLHADFGRGISFNGIVGLMGIVRPDEGALLARYSSAFQHYISREHYLMWRPSATGAYVRAGRFLAPYGLRLAEHLMFTRRYTGMAHSEESYNLSGGYVGADWELHLTAFMPVPAGAPEPLQAYGFRSSGFVGYYEQRFEEKAAVGVQTRLAFAGEEQRYQVGVVGKYWWDEGKLLCLAEVDYMRERFPHAGTGRNQTVTHLGVTAFPWRGVMPGLSWERYQEDLSLPRLARDAFDLKVNFFPWAHFEVQLFGRLQTVGLGKGGETSKLLMLQLHYYM